MARAHQMADDALNMRCVNIWSDITGVSRF